MVPRVIRGLVFFGLCLVWSTAAWSQTPTCDGLAPDKKQLATAILQAQHPYECCDETIAACLNQRPRCRLAVRLANDICRRAGAGQDRPTIDRALEKRAASMGPAVPTVPIDLTNAAVAGESSARVSVVAYVCGRCQFCSRLLPSLHKLITEGTLKSKAKLYARPFPIRSHANSTEAGMGLMASQSLGKYWPFLLHMYANFDSFEVAKMPEWAAAVGMDRGAFSNLLNDASLRSALTEAKKEGVRNKVESTPTLFINGKRYQGDLNLAAVQDVLEEQGDRSNGRTHE